MFVPPKTPINAVAAATSTFRILLQIDFFIFHTSSQDGKMILLSQRIVIFVACRSALIIIIRIRRRVIIIDAVHILEF